MNKKDVFFSVWTQIRVSLVLLYLTLLRKQSPRISAYTLYF